MGEATRGAEPCCDQFGPLLDRRQLLGLGAALVAVAALSAFGGISGVEAGSPAGSNSSGSGAATNSALQDFLTLSSVLTGAASLDPVLAASYAAGLVADLPGTLSLADLAARAGIGNGATAPSLDALGAAGFFEQGDVNTLAEAVLSAWYSGTVTTPAGPSTLSYTGALAWTQLGFAHAAGVCGGPFGFWSKAPA